MNFKANIYAFVVLLFCVQMAFAQFGGGTGTETDPYKLSNLAHLEELSDSVASDESTFSTVRIYFRLTNDIDASATSDTNSPSNNNGLGFTPIRYFVGTLNGGGFAIKNLYINRPESDYVGLFRSTYCTIDSLGIVDCSIVGALSVSVNHVGTGSLIGSFDGKISHCYATGSVSGRDNVGGLVGTAYGDITYSSAAVSVSGENAVVARAEENQHLGDSLTIPGGNYVGGLIGYARDIAYGYDISYCSATGSVSGNNNVGGLVGYSDIEISHSSASGSVLGVRFVADGRHYRARKIGGLAGWVGSILYSCATGDVTGEYVVGGLAGGSSSVKDCYAMGSVTATDTVGGLAGETHSHIYRNYATGLVRSDVYYDDIVGGLVGIGWGSSYSYWDSISTGQLESVDGIGKNTTEMKTQSTYTNWDFVNTWAIDANKNYGYPYLQWQPDSTITAIKVVETPIYEVSHLAISPNPVSSSAGEVTIYFPQNIVGTGTCTIYDAQSNRIDHQEVNLTQGTALQWDLRNEQGRKVAAGGYLAVLQITDSMGQMHFQKAMIGVKQ